MNITFFWGLKVGCSPLIWKCSGSWARSVFLPWWQCNACKLWPWCPCIRWHILCLVSSLSRRGPHRSDNGACVWRFRRVSYRSGMSQSAHSEPISWVHSMQAGVRFRLRCLKAGLAQELRYFSGKKSSILDPCKQSSDFHNQVMR